MKSIICVTSNVENFYDRSGFLSRIKDKLKIKLVNNEYIKELDVKVANVTLPPNFNRKAYVDNLTYAKKISKCKDVILSAKTLRPLDYNYFNEFQKRFLAYSVIKSIQLMLRMRKKSLKNSCVVIYDAVEEINYNIILELAKQSKYIIFLSPHLAEATKFADYIIANFGVSPIVTDDELYAIKVADFIVSSKNYKFGHDKLVWCLDNSISADKNIIAVNDVSYNVPWDTVRVDYSIELIGAILCQMQESDVEKALKYNGIYLKEVKFNKNVIY